MLMPKSYAPEFRRRVVDLVRSGRSVAEVAADVGVSEGSLYRWKAQDQVDLGERVGPSSLERVELAEARRRIRELETEVAIVRQASALFVEGAVRPKGSSR
jgi:transposase-like protein